MFTNSFAATPLFPIPGGLFFDAMVIDPSATDDFYVTTSDINNSTLFRLTRTGPDSSTVANAISYASPAYFIFRLAFVPDVVTVPAALRGQLLAAAAPAASFAAGIYIVDKTTLALTLLADVGTFNGNGPLTADSQGNVYTSVPPGFTSFSPCELMQFLAADLAGAIGGTPVASTEAVPVISASAGEWNISAMTARDEGGSTFIYYSTYEHASISRLCVRTGERRLFVLGYGGVADGYLHFAQGGTLAFSSPNGDFLPAGGGGVELAVPFSVFTPGGGSYHSVFVFRPEPVNVAVASLNVTSAPAAINSGVPFSITLTAHNSGGGTITSNVAVVVTALGAGTLEGFTITSKPGSAIVVNGIVYTTGTVPGTVTLSAHVSGAPGVSASTAAITVVAPATALAVVNPPTSVNQTTFFSVRTELRDAGGAVVQAGLDASREVSVVALSGPGSLWGQTTVVASAGVADFDALIIDTTGTYVLEFSSPG
jgi:hypothetical protein